MPQCPFVGVSLQSGKSIDLIDAELIDPQQRQWQYIEIPLSLFKLQGRPIDGVRFFGCAEGRLHLDGLRLQSYF